MRELDCGDGEGRAGRNGGSRTEALDTDSPRNDDKIEKSEAHPCEGTDQVGSSRSEGAGSHGESDSSLQTSNARRLLDEQAESARSVGIAFALVGVGFQFVAALVPRDDAIVWIPAGLLGWGFILAGMKSIASAKHILFSAGAKETRESDARPPIVFLRSFRDDAAISHVSTQIPRGFRDLALLSAPANHPLTFEEKLATAFARLGPFVAIGRPGESSPPPGAAREYCSQTEWQNSVLALMREARLICVLVDYTEGLSWEISQIVELGLCDKLVLTFMPATRKRRRARWRAFVEKLPEGCSIQIPDENEVEDAAVVQCAEDGSYRIYESTRRGPFGIENTDYDEAVMWVDT